MTKLAMRYIIDPDLVRWLRRVAKRRRCSMSQVLRDLIIAEMARERAAEGTSK